MQPRRDLAMPHLTVRRDAEHRRQPAHRRRPAVAQRQAQVTDRLGEPDSVTYREDFGGPSKSFHYLAVKHYDMAEPRVA